MTDKIDARNDYERDLAEETRWECFNDLPLDAKVQIALDHDLICDVDIEDTYTENEITETLYDSSLAVDIVERY